MQDIKERERESLEIVDQTQTPRYIFEVRATALRLRLHTEGFLLYVHTGPPTQGPPPRIWQIQIRSTQLLSPITQTSI